MWGQRVFYFSCVFSILHARQIPIFLKFNNSADPCLNFYSYVCDDWLKKNVKPSYEPIWSPWIATKHEIKNQILEILQIQDGSLQSVQMFYKSCINITTSEEKYLRQLLSLVQSLGGWPLTNQNTKIPNFDWLKLLSRLTRLLGIHPILNINLDLDYKNPKSAMIYIEPGDLILPETILTSTKYPTELQAYEKWISDSALHLSGNKTNPDRVRDIVKFEMQLATLTLAKSKTERVNIGKLNRKFPGDWLGALNGIFGSFLKLDLKTIISIKKYDFLKNVFLLIDKTDKRVIADYLIWACVKELSRHTTHHMRDLNFLIDKAILGVRDDLTRESECLENVITYFSPVLVPFYVREFSNPAKFREITGIFESLKLSFIDVVMQNGWLSREGQLLIVDKIRDIKLHLGFPWEYNNTYKSLHLTNNHLTNILKLKRWKLKKHHLQILKHNPIIWPTNPFDVNAFYSILQNSIFVPLGLIQNPFFSLNYTKSRNYGSLGALIAHEMAHSLDPIGISADPNGKITNWLPENDLHTYTNQLECFHKTNTIIEDLADHVALKITLNALKTSTQFKEFFTSFGQMWCETPNLDIFKVGAHSPNEERVQNLLKDFNFRAVFLCAPTSPCELW